MADIRQYRKEKSGAVRGDGESADGEYRGRLKKHKTRVRIIAAAVSLSVAALVVILCLVNYRSAYKSYSVRNSVSRRDNGYASYMDFGSGYVRCSRDGTAMYSYDGEQQWNKTYEMKSPLNDVCGQYMAVADTEGNEIFIFDRGGYISTVNTALPIVQIRVSAQGTVAATLEDSNAVYINMYASDGTKISGIKSTVSGNGVPVSMDLSPDGHLLIVSYTSVDAQKLATSVVFYNFGEVGQSEVERVVGGYDTYGEQLVAEVKFTGGTTAVAVGENVVSFFKVSEYPKLVAEVAPEYEIDKVFYSDKYVGLVYTDKNNAKRIAVYDMSGNPVTTAEAGGGYSRYAFAGDSLLMYGDSSVKLVNMKGKVLFDGSIEGGIVEMIPISGNSEYICLGSDKLMRIEFKHGG
ncbi:MAG: DUF5711 family protein [Butyrivibrio sp.]|nr:DUF5711 family protein [Butyrivibrio sp.]